MNTLNKSYSNCSIQSQTSSSSYQLQNILSRKNSIENLNFILNEMTTNVVVVNNNNNNVNNSKRKRRKRRNKRGNKKNLDKKIV